MKQLTRRVTILAIGCTLILVGFSRADDVWRGTAPFCAGSCLSGEIQKGVSDSGDGGYCITGHKVLCGGRSSSCPVKETKTSCYGVVMVCDNGFYESPTNNWHTCGKYACGVCFGIDSLNTSSFTSGACKQGFVWREATKTDHVCVTPETRSQAAADNANAAARRSPDGGASGPDTCKQGFVWREGVKDDRVCVAPETRSQAAAENANAAARRSPNGGASGPDTCKQGFVWREVVPADHVCVVPQARANAVADNNLASQRKASQ